MKAFYKFLGIASVCALALTGCQKAYAPYTPGDPAGNQDVWFSLDNASTVVLSLDAKSFDVTLERAIANSSDAITVPVSLWCSKSGVASAPESVTFSAGSVEAKVTITLGEMDPFQEYQLKLSIPEEYTQPYKSASHYPNCGLIFYKEDYKVAATCTFYDYFWTEEESSQNIEYSEMLETYRISPFPSGSPILFKWDKASKISYASTTKIATGFVHSSYGAISATPTSVSYDAESGLIAFKFKWTVSAGSFGEYPEYAYDIKWAN